MEDQHVAARHPLSSLSDDELLRRLGDLLRQSRRTEAELVAHIGEVDARGLYARFAANSMFTYCTEVLHLSAAEAYLRITVARVAREHPILLVMLADGRLHLSSIERLAPHLTCENRDVVLARAVHRSKREVEELVAELSPRADVPALIRKLPDRRPAVSRGSLFAAPAAIPPASTGTDQPERPAAGRGGLRPDGVPGDSLRTGAVPHPRVPAPVAPGALIRPTAPSRYKVQFTASAELRDKLERLRSLMRRSVPVGDLAAVIEAAVTEKLQRLEARRFGLTRQSRVAGRTASAAQAASRNIPAEVRRAVHQRDGGQCRYLDSEGRRCGARSGLEYHHRVPFGCGGAHTVENVSLLCRAHNRYMAEVDYGKDAISRAAVRGRSPLPATPP